MNWWLFLWVPLWIIVGIVAFVLLILLIIIILLAIPIKYEAYALIKNGQRIIRAKVTYPFVNYIFINKKGETKTQLKIAGRIFGGSQNKKEIPATAPKTEKPKPLHSETTKAIEAPSTTKTVKKDPVEKPPPKPPPKENFLLRLKNRFITTRDKVYNVIHHPDRKRFTKWTITAIKKTIRTLKPQGIEIKGTVGFADPALTGLLVGGAGVFATVANLQAFIEIAPKFNIEETEITLKASIVGKLSLLKFIWPTITWAIKCGTVLLFRKIQNKIIGGRKK